MKNLLLLVLVFVVSFSCNKKNEKEKVWVYTSLYKDTVNDMKTADAAANVAIPIASKVYAARNYIAGADEVGTVIAVGTLFDNA